MKKRKSRERQEMVVEYISLGDPVRRHRDNTESVSSKEHHHTLSLTVVKLYYILPSSSVLIKKLILPSLFLVRFLLCACHV